MPIEIQLPRLGWSMEEGKFLAWLKNDGDFIKEGEPLFTLESDKAAQEVESIDSGILSIPATGPKSGDVIKVGHVLGYLLHDGESAPFSNQPAPKTKEPIEAQQPGKKSIHSSAPILLPKLKTESPSIVNSSSYHEPPHLPLCCCFRFSHLRG